MTTDYERGVRAALGVIASLPLDATFSQSEIERRVLALLPPASIGAGGEADPLIDFVEDVLKETILGDLGSCRPLAESIHREFTVTGRLASPSPTTAEPRGCPTVGADVETYSERDIEMMARGMASWSNVYWTSRDIPFHEMPEDERAQFIQQARDLAAIRTGSAS